MANKKTDAQIVTILDQHLRFTTGYSDSRLSKERERVLQYYDGVYPLPTHKGNSKYVAQDVYESVQAEKATLLEVFSTDQTIVEFTPSNAQDVEPARIATEYCSYWVFQRNDGLTIFDEVIEDGLLARIGICQFSWEEETEEAEGQLGPATMGQLSMHPAVMDANTSVDSLDDHGDGTYTANLTKRQKKGRVALECVPPEDFGISARARDIKSAKLVWRRKALTKGELLAEGYTAELVERLKADTTEMMVDPEKAARFELLDDRSVIDDSNDLDDSASSYTVYYCYAKIDVDGTGIPKLWHICKCGGTILSKDRVSIRPFATFDPIHKSHSFYGHNFATKVMPIQNVNSVLTRSILDHAVITNVPRWMVVKGGLMNPKELTDTRVGGLVNVTRPDGVVPMAQSQLNPFVFQTLQMMDQRKEDTTGVSRLSKGLNRDAISTQNSQGLIEDLVSLSDRRAKLIARRFSKFLQDLYLGIYQLVLDHQDYEDAIEVTGNWIPVDPRQWRERTLMSASISVGYGEQRKEADDLVQVDGFLRSRGDPGMYPAQQQFNVLSKALLKRGYKDVTNYIVPPQQQQPPQPDPMAVAEVKAKTDTAQAAVLTAQATLQRVQFEREKWNHEYVLKAHKEVAGHALKSDAQTLKERQEIHREAVDAAEIKLQQEELAQAKTTQGPFAHPNG